VLVFKWSSNGHIAWLGARASGSLGNLYGLRWRLLKPNQLMEASMNMKLVSAVTILAAFAAAPAFAQQQPAMPKASKAEVEKVLAGIKADKAKMTAYCDSAKLDDEANAIGAKNPKDPKLQSLASQIDELNKKIGPDFEKIMSSELDEASVAFLEDFSKSCK
jgi:hypothetical protein